MPVRHFYLLSHYICYGLLFLFSVFWLQKEWMQYVFWGDKGERSRVYYLLSPPCWTFFQVSLMIRWYCNLSLYMIHLSLYCRNTSFLSMRVIRCMMHISHQEYRDILELDCIHSFWSQHTEKRNNTISQMRLRSVFKMRISILNTATTEQMGYGIISFFVCLA